MALPIKLTQHMEPPEGIEPSLTDYETDILPLNYGGTTQRPKNIVAYRRVSHKEHNSLGLLVDSLGLEPRRDRL